MSLLLPRKQISETELAKKARGYARHKCGGIAFYFTKFGKAWFNYDASEILFKDGQIKLENKPVEEYRCPDCNAHLRGEDLKLVKIVQEDESNALHQEAHNRIPIGEICELCGQKRKK